MPSPQPNFTRPKGRPNRPSSFHGRLPGTPAVETTSSLRRPKTDPDLLAGRPRTPAAPTSPSTASTPARVPTKVLVSVTVLRSLGALQVVASTDWTVAELISAAVRQYAKEGRRPLLPGGSDPKDYALHYSQFSLQPIPSDEKLINLGSRTFFLCPKYQQELQQHHQQLQQQKMSMPSAPVTIASPPHHSSTSYCSNEAHREDLRLHPKTSTFPRRPWLRFIDFLL